MLADRIRLRQEREEEQRHDHAEARHRGPGAEAADERTAERRTRHHPERDDRVDEPDRSRA